MTITLIGDVHGQFDKYYEIASKAESSICIGDFGFGAEWSRLHYSDLRPENHKIIRGNHDAPIGSMTKFDLGDFGISKLNGITFFFVRGGLSIDRFDRKVEEIIKKSAPTYWVEEELDFQQMTQCLNLYCKVKPDIVLTHVPPNRFINKMLNVVPGKPNTLTKFGWPEDFKENTSLLCDMMFDAHKPNLWISGHIHVPYREDIGDSCTFIGLGILEQLKI